MESCDDDGSESKSKEDGHVGDDGAHVEASFVRTDIKFKTSWIDVEWKGFIQGTFTRNKTSDDTSSGGESDESRGRHGESR